MSDSVIIQDSPYLHFLKELEDALAREHLRLSDDARVYLAGLLSAVAWDEIERRTHDAQTQAEALVHALSQQHGELREGMLRGVGNSALILCGIWWRRVDYQATWRSGADQEYHERIGRYAFSRIEQELFQELANKFIGIIDVFARIGETVHQHDERRTVDAYVSLLQTNNRLAEKILREQGLLVVMPDSEN